MTHSVLTVGVLAPDLTHDHGWAHYATSLIAALRRAGVTVRAVTAKNSPPIAGLDRLPILPNVAPSESGMLLGQMQAWRQARAFLARCDVIHALCEPYAPLAAVITGRRPLFVTAHGSYALVTQERRFPVNRIYAAAYRRAQMIAVSNYTAQRLADSLSGVRVSVIPNGIDAERFEHVQHGGGSVPTVLFVGAVKARKGVRELVRAAARVRETIPNVCVRIVGSLEVDSAYAVSVRGEIARLGLEETVTLMGRVSDADLLRYYAAADVFALPSLNVDWKFEGFGLALLEASAAGLPVIGTRGCGAEDAVIDGVTGVLVDQGDLVAGLTTTITDLLTDRDRARRLGAAGRDHASAHTWDRTAAALIETYQAALKA